MDVINSAQLRAHLADYLDRASDDHMAIVIARRRGRPAVLIGLDEYNALCETGYLMNSSENAKRLTEALEDVRAGNTTEHGLIDE